MLNKKPNVNHTDRPRPQRKLLDRARQIMRRDCDNSNSGQSIAEEVGQEPYEYWGRMREEDPVHWNALDELWLITRDDDLVWLIRHPGLFSSAFWRRDPRGLSPSVDEGIFWLGSPRNGNASQPSGAYFQPHVGTL